MMSCLEIVKNTLEALTEKCFHYEAFFEDESEKDQYIVWAEDNEYNSLGTDNYKGYQTVEGTIDYFTKSGVDEMPETIQNALNRARIGWEINSIQYEDETGFIHFEWLFRVRNAYAEDGSQGAG